MLSLVCEVFTRRASMVIGKLAKKQGLAADVFLELHAPEKVKVGLKVAKRLHTRYVQGDYRHSEMELGRIEALCNWLIEEAQKLGGHPVRPVEFERDKMVKRGAPCAPGTYAKVFHKVRTEW